MSIIVEVNVLRQMGKAKLEKKARHRKERNPMD